MLPGFAPDSKVRMLMEMREMIFGKSLSEPVCTIKQGKAPAQVKAEPKPEVKKETQAPKIIDELGLDFYGATEYNPDELPEGLEAQEEDEEL